MYKVGFWKDEFTKHSYDTEVNIRDLDIHISGQSQNNKEIFVDLFLSLDTNDPIHIKVEFGIGFNYTTLEKIDYPSNSQVSRVISEYSNYHGETI